MLPWDEFSEFFLEEYTLKQNRKWEELYATDQELDGYEGKSVVINYTYGDGGGHRTIIHWSFALDENKTIRTVSYTGSSSFAFWWCNFTDEIDEEDITHPVCKGCGEEASCWNYNSDHEVICEDCGGCEEQEEKNE